MERQHSPGIMKSVTTVNCSHIFGVIEEIRTDGAVCSNGHRWSKMINYVKLHIIRHIKSRCVVFIFWRNVTMVAEIMDFGFTLEPTTRLYFHTLFLLTQLICKHSRCFMPKNCLIKPKIHVYFWSSLVQRSAALSSNVMTPPL